VSDTFVESFWAESSWGTAYPVAVVRTTTVMLARNLATRM